MKLCINTVIPLNQQFYYLYLKDTKLINKYLKPTFCMKLKREINSRLNPYSTYRQKHNITSTQEYILKKIQYLLKLNIFKHFFK